LLLHPSCSDRDMVVALELPHTGSNQHFVRQSDVCADPAKDIYRVSQRLEVIKDEQHGQIRPKWTHGEALRQVCPSIESSILPPRRLNLACEVFCNVIYGQHASTDRPRTVRKKIHVPELNQRIAPKRALSGRAWRTASVSEVFPTPPLPASVISGWRSSSNTPRSSSSSRRRAT